MDTPNQRVVNTLEWDDRAEDWLTTWNLTRAEAESIILFDPRPSLDPHSRDVGYPIARYRRGDVIVVVGFKNRARPKVLHVAVNTPGEKGAAPIHRGATGGPGSSLPTSVRELKTRILALGYRLEWRSSG